MDGSLPQNGDKAVKRDDVLLTAQRHLVPSPLIPRDETQGQRSVGQKKSWSVPQPFLFSSSDPFLMAGKIISLSWHSPQRIRDPCSYLEETFRSLQHHGRWNSFLRDSLVRVKGIASPPSLCIKEFPSRSFDSFGSSLSTPKKQSFFSSSRLTSTSASPSPLYLLRTAKERKKTLWHPRLDTKS